MFSFPLGRRLPSSPQMTPRSGSSIHRWINKRVNAIYYITSWETRHWHSGCIFRRERGISPSLVGSQYYSTSFFYLPTPRQNCFLVAVSIFLVSPTNATLVNLTALIVTLAAALLIWLCLRLGLRYSGSALAFRPPFGLRLSGASRPRFGRWRKFIVSHGTYYVSDFYFLFVRWPAQNFLTNIIIIHTKFVIFVFFVCGKYT